MSTTNLTPAQIAARALRAEARHEREIARLTKLLNDTERALLARDQQVADIDGLVRFGSFEVIAGALRTEVVRAADLRAILAPEPTR